MFEFLTDHRYVCPFLLALQGIIKRQQWKYTSSGWTLMCGKNYEAHCIWPRWLTGAECRFWNSLPGIKLRSLIGSQQREARLRWTSEPDESEEG